MTADLTGRRVFVVGCLGERRLTALLPFLESGSRDPAPRWEPSPAAAAAPASLTDRSLHLAERPGPLEAYGGGNTAGPIAVATACTAHGVRYDFDSETLIVHPAGCRRLTPTEYERLQGFSWREGGEWTDGHTCLCGKNHGRSVGVEPCTCPDGPRYRALGNAVAVPVAEWVLRQVVRAESEASE